MSKKLPELTIFVKSKIFELWERIEYHCTQADIYFLYKLIRITIFFVISHILLFYASDFVIFEDISVLMIAAHGNKEEKTIS